MWNLAAVVSYTSSIGNRTFRSRFSTQRTDRTIGGATPDSESPGNEGNPRPDGGHKSTTRGSSSLAYVAILVIAIFVALASLWLWLRT